MALPLSPLPPPESFNPHVHPNYVFCPHGWGIGSDCAWCLSQVRNIRKVLREIDKPFGLYPNFLSPVSGNWVQRKYWPRGFSSQGSQGRALAPGFTSLGTPAPVHLTPPSILSIRLSQQLSTLLHDPDLQECPTYCCHSDVTEGKAL